MRKGFGDQALVQRCTLHKRRNVVGHLPKDQVSIPPFRGGITYEEMS
jgi:hypothetical protein